MPAPRPVISIARRPAWLHTTRRNDTVLQAWRNPTLGADVPCCRTAVHNTPQYEVLTLYYPWHRLHDQQVSVVRLFCKRGLPIYRCVEPGRVGYPSVELPAWMFDRARCACMRGASAPSVDLQALHALQQLLCRCKGSPVVVAQMPVQTGSQPQTGDTDAHETQPAVQAAGSLPSDPSATSVGKNAHYRPEGTPSATPGDAVQPSSATTDRANSERGRS
jgi:hypothetical protein